MKIFYGFGGILKLKVKEMQEIKGSEIPRAYDTFRGRLSENLTDFSKDNFGSVKHLK